MSRNGHTIRCAFAGVLSNRESLKCLTSPDPKKAAACRKWLAWADHLASPHGRMKKIEIEKSKEEQKKIVLSIRKKTQGTMGG